MNPNLPIEAVEIERRGIAPSGWVFLQDKLVQGLDEQLRRLQLVQRFLRGTASLEDILGLGPILDADPRLRTLVEGVYAARTAGCDPDSPKLLGAGPSVEANEQQQTADADEHESVLNSFAAEVL